jgi:predicted membrane protein
MENTEINKENNEDVWKQWERSHRRGKIIGGIFVVLVGSLFLAKELGAQLPEWLFTWQMLLIAVGSGSLIKHGFKRFGGLIPMAIGGIFMIQEFYPMMAIKPLLWPILIIIIGLVIIFKPRRNNWRKWNRHHRRWHRHGHYQNYDEYCKKYYNVNPSTEDFINATVVFGAVQKNIITKDFKGGDISIVFGGAEINLMHADFTGTATLEVSQVFGGTKLIIPPNWKLRSEIETVMGSVEDKRPIPPPNLNEEDKVLILKGSVVMGGIDIKSY